MLAGTHPDTDFTVEIVESSSGRPELLLTWVDGPTVGDVARAAAPVASVLRPGTPSAERGTIGARAVRTFTPAGYAVALVVFATAGILPAALTRPEVDCRSLLDTLNLPSGLDPQVLAAGRLLARLFPSDPATPTWGQWVQVEAGEALTRCLPATLLPRQEKRARK